MRETESITRNKDSSFVILCYTKSILKNVSADWGLSLIFIYEAIRRQQYVRRHWTGNDWTLWNVKNIAMTLDKNSSFCALVIPYKEHTQKNIFKKCTEEIIYRLLLITLVKQLLEIFDKNLWIHHPVNSVILYKEHTHKKYI